MVEDGGSRIEERAIFHPPLTILDPLGMA